MTGTERARWLVDHPVVETLLTDVHRDAGQDPLWQLALLASEGRSRAAIRTWRALAELLSSPLGLAALLDGCSVAAHGVLQAALWRGGAIAQPHDAQVLLGSLTGEEIDTAAAELDRAMIARRGNGAWLTLYADVTQHLAAPGVGIELLEQRLNSEQIAQILRAHGAKCPSTKAERLERLRSIVSDRDAVERAIESLPERTQRAFWRVAGNVEPMRFEDIPAQVHYFGWFGYHRAQESELAPLARLGLVHGDDERHTVWTWRETIQALEQRLPPISLAPKGPRVDVSPVPLVGDSARVPSVIGDAERLLDAWRRNPPPALADGGLGVSPVRAAAKKLGIAPARVGLLVNWFTAVKLMQVAVAGYEGRGRNRRPTFAWTVAGQDWPAESPLHRWADLVTWWAANAPFDEHQGAPERLSTGGYATMDLPRQQFLRYLFGLEPGVGFDAETLGVLLWRRHPAIFQPDLVDGLSAVLRAAGLAPPDGPVGLTAAGRALLAGALERIDVADGTSFIVQADHTILVEPSLRSDIAMRLRSVADVVSEGAATVLRITEASLARALGHSETVEGIEALFADHSAKGVPQSLQYLIRDVARRQEQLTIIEGMTVVVSDDRALIAQATKIAQAKLRAVGAHAAVSPLGAAAVRSALGARNVHGLTVVATNGSTSVHGGSGHAPTHREPTTAKRTPSHKAGRETLTALRELSDRIDGTAADRFFQSMPKA